MNKTIQKIIDQAGTDSSGKWISVTQIPELVNAVLADLLANGYIDQDNHDEYRSHLQEQ